MTSLIHSIASSRRADLLPVALLAVALLAIVQLAACNQSHAPGAFDAAAGDPTACEAAGGRCQTADLPCGEGSVFGGYDRCSEPSDACCLPAPSRDGGLVAVEDGGLDARAPIDAGAPSDDAGAADAGPGVAGLIACGAQECDAATEGCLASCLYATDERMPACVALNEDGRWPAAECPTGEERFPRLWLTCDGNEDCPATERCHLLYGSLGQYAYCDACEPPCDLRHFHQLCRTDADCPAEVPRCSPNPDLPGYSTCVADGE